MSSTGTDETHACPQTYKSATRDNLNPSPKLTFLTPGKAPRRMKKSDLDTSRGGMKKSDLDASRGGMRERGRQSERLVPIADKHKCSQDISMSPKNVADTGHFFRASSSRESRSTRSAMVRCFCVYTHISLIRLCVCARTRTRASACMCV